MPQNATLPCGPNHEDAQAWRDNVKEAVKRRLKLRTIHNALNRKGYLSSAVIVGPAKRPLILGATLVALALGLPLHTFIERIFREMTPASGASLWWAITTVVLLVFLIHPVATCVLGLRRDH